jgi:hypothetical protein
MQHSSETIGAIAGALAKAQIELANPWKSLTATIQSPFPREGDRSFRYASLSSGLDLVRKSLGRHEIATVQTTSIDESAGLIRLTTTLAHSSGEWLASVWPVCPISETSAPHRMGAALTYARRYALFTLVGIAGEDDLDAPDLNGALDDALSAHPIGTRETSQDAGQHAPPASTAPESNLTSPRAPSPHPRRGRPVSLPRVILPPENSLSLRDHLISELAASTDTETLTLWAGRILPQKNQLTTPDAQAIETAFAAKLGELEGDRPAKDPNPAMGNDKSDKFRSNRAIPGHTARLEPIGAAQRCATKRDNGSAAGSREKTVTPIGKTLRMRDRDHLKFVSAQPCLVCARSPSDAHHLKFAQGRALGRKVSDEFTVPLCRTHHRELHLRGDERTWWQQLNVDPTFTASALWTQTHPGLAQGEVLNAGLAGQQKECASAANGALYYETKPIIAADTP